MSQLLKHYWINRDTGQYAITPAQGYMIPNIEGLERIYDLTDENNVPYSLSTCPDETVVNPTEGLWILTQSEWDNEINLYDSRQEQKRYDLIRIIRDEILATTDWIVIKGTEQEISLDVDFKTWRQELRDLPSSQTFPKGFPPLPLIVKDNSEVLRLYDRWSEVSQIPMINDPLSVE